MRGNPLLLIGRRFLQAAPVVMGIILVTFILTRALPGDPAVFFAGPAADEKSIADIRASLGFDKSWPEQFWLYLQGLSCGDLGKSISTGQPVLEELATRLPASLELTLTSLLLAIAILLGVLAATRPNSFVDHLCRLVVTIGVSLPTFFTGLFLVYVFYFLLGFSPAPIGRLSIIHLAPEHLTGFYLVDSLIAGDFEFFRAALSQMILPASTLAIFALAPIARMTRARDAGGFIERLRTHGARERLVAPFHPLDIRLSERHPSRPHYVGNGILFFAWSERFGGTGLRLARNRLLRH